MIRWDDTNYKKRNSYDICAKFKKLPEQCYHNLWEEWKRDVEKAKRVGGESTTQAYAMFLLNKLFSMKSRALLLIDTRRDNNKTRLEGIGLEGCITPPDFVFQNSNFTYVNGNKAHAPRVIVEVKSIGIHPGIDGHSSKGEQSYTWLKYVGGKLKLTQLDSYLGYLSKGTSMVICTDLLWWEVYSVKSGSTGKDIVNDIKFGYCAIPKDSGEAEFNALMTALETLLPRS